MPKKKVSPVSPNKHVKKHQLKFEPVSPDLDYYTPASLRGKDFSEMKKEFTRFRDIAQKRLKRVSTEFPQSEVMQFHPSSFPTLKELKEESRNQREFERKVRHTLSDLTRFVQSPSTTVTGQRAIEDKRLQTLIDYGFFDTEETEERNENLPEGKQKHDDPLDRMTKEELRGVMKFVHWVARTQHLNIMYYDTFKDKIKGSAFRQAVRRTGYGKAKDFGRKNYGRWFEEITGQKPEPVRRSSSKTKKKGGSSSSRGFGSLRSDIPD